MNVNGGLFHLKSNLIFNSSFILQTLPPHIFSFLSVVSRLPELSVYSDTSESKKVYDRLVGHKLAIISHGLPDLSTKVAATFR